MTTYYISKKKKIHKSVHKENGYFYFYSWDGTKWHFCGTGNDNWLTSQCCTLSHLIKISEKEAFIELL